MGGASARWKGPRGDRMRGSARLLGAAALMAALAGFSDGRSRPALDVLIKGGTVYDGTLGEPFVADIGIKGDRIAAIGNLAGETAAEVIDAKGLVVAPGFIDVHNHSDMPFRLAGWLRLFAYIDPAWKGNHNYIFQGVTTIVTQNCGWGYPDINDWFGIVNSIRFGTNVYGLVPHGDIRNALFGPENPQPLSPAQLELMKERVAQEMRKGAIGMSVGLEYAPGCMATTDELVELAKVVKKCGGIYVTHIRDNTGTLLEDKQFGVIKALKEAIEIGKRAAIPVHVSHLQINAPWNGLMAKDLLNLIEAARKEGVDITADAYAYNAGCTLITLLTPFKYRTSAGIRDEYKTPQGKAELKKAVEETFRYLGPDKVMINLFPERKSYEGKTLREIADAEKRDPADLYVDIVTNSKKAPMCFYFDQKEEIVEAIHPHPYVFTASDGWVVPKGSGVPHPRCYGNFPRKIREYVMNKKLMTLKDAIRSMTSLPAEKFRMNLRGKLAPGFYADITVFDPGAIRDKATYQDPTQYSEGIVDLMVNGVLAIKDGKATSRRGGRALRSM
jgi:N-acyl-D-amino-acid deacylase